MSDWSSDVCSSDLRAALQQVVRVELVGLRRQRGRAIARRRDRALEHRGAPDIAVERDADRVLALHLDGAGDGDVAADVANADADRIVAGDRSEEHTSELKSLMRISYAVFCLQKNNTKIPIYTHHKLRR